jgi:ketosteroid isomerase-like protein
MTDFTESNDSSEAEALAAADAIIADFGSHRALEYFAGFSPDATFVFHTHPIRLESREEYEQLWQQWEDDYGFRVHSCASSNRRLQLVDDIAIFTHDVVTELTMDGEVEIGRERETIVLRRQGGTWLAIHEHLSPAPLH